MKHETYSSGRRKMIPNTKSKSKKGKNNGNDKNVGKYKYCINNNYHDVFSLKVHMKLVYMTMIAYSWEKN